MRILHIITSLEMGGAQTALVRLIEQTEELTHRVLALQGEGSPFVDRLTARNVSFEASVNPIMLAVTARAWRPDVIMGWMYHGALAAYATRLSVPAAALIWNIRHDPGDNLSYEKPMTRWVIQCCARLSSRTDRIVYNSHTSALRHTTRLRYAEPQTFVIRNGFDTDRFQPRPLARNVVRAQLGIDVNTFVVGCVACHRPQKNIPMLITAATKLHATGFPLKVVLVGTGTEELSGSSLLHALGERDDVDNLLQAFDCFVLCSSWGESTPNALAEAMACGLVVIGTTVGGIPELIGDAGLQVPPDDPAALAAALSEVASIPCTTRSRLGIQARTRIVDQYSMGRMIADYYGLWESATSQSRRVA